MGNGIRKLNLCFVDAGEISRRHDIAIVFTDSHLDEGLGHSYCYIRPDPYHISSSENHYEDTTTIVQKTTTFSCISGASVSANTSTPLSTALIDVYMYNSFDRASSFESSTSFASIPLQPVPRGCMKNTDVLPRKSMGVSCSGPIERGFLSGPIERGFVSGPIDKGLYSGSIEKVYDQLQRSYSHGGFEFKPKSKKGGLMKNLRRAIAKTLSRGRESIFAPIKGVVSINESDWVNGLVKNCENITVSSTNLSRQLSLNCDDSDEDESLKSQNLQWAQGKAGEDRVHIVISEKNGWVFVGIYDGFNGPDAPDFLLSNLYSAVHKELKGLLWNDKLESEAISVAAKPALSMDSNLEKEVPFPIGEFDQSQLRNGLANGCFEKENHPSTTGIFDPDSELKQNQTRVLEKGMARKSEESQRRWKCEWDRERLEHDTNSKDQTDQLSSNGVVEINHADVLKALSRALKKTEEAYLEIADRMVMENPELALMGSCVLAMLMKGDDVYLMNVGDSRAVLAQKSDPDVCPRKNASQDFERINQETLCDLQAFDGDEFGELPTLSSLQLTLDHSTNVKEEVKRIKREHLDDACAVMNDRVKGSLKVTRAFGAGFLKQPKWNNALLEMFRIDYIGTSPYINCNPSLYHHKLDVRDRFLILSSDGLYQYFTNEEAVSQVESFMASSPEGDPAQHLIEEVLFRAAKKAGMDFHELLEIPQGDRRKFHDDVSIIIISLEGRIWRSSV